MGYAARRHEAYLVITPLVKPLTREVLVAGTAYRETITAAGIELREKGRRRVEIAFAWDDLVARAAVEDDAARASGSMSAVSATAVPSKAVLAEAARDVRASAGALTRADASLTQIGGSPAALMATDPGVTQREQQDHWFVEPLLTVADVAAILRVSRRTVRDLPLSTISVAGGTRFHQSEIRAFLGRYEVKSPSKRRH